MKKHFLLFTTEMVKVISGILKTHNLFWSSKNVTVWKNPNNHLYQTIVIFFGQAYGERNYSVVIRQNEHTAIISLYAKQVSLNLDDGHVSNHELLLFILKLGDKKGSRKVYPGLWLEPVATMNGEKQVTIAKSCLEAIKEKHEQCLDSFDFKTTSTITTDTLPPPSLMDELERMGIITLSGRSKRV